MENNGINMVELEYLQKATKLGPIDSIKVQQEKRACVKKRDIYRKDEGELLEVDYAPAYKLEYDLRFRALEKAVFKDWQKYGDGLELDEYTKEIIKQNVQESTRS